MIHLDQKEISGEYRDHGDHSDLLGEATISSMAPVDAALALSGDKGSREIEEWSNEVEEAGG